MQNARESCEIHTEFLLESLKGRVDMDNIKMVLTEINHGDI